MSKTRVLSFICALMLLTLSSQSMAVTETIIGANCQPGNDQNQWTTNTIGEIINYGSSWITVFCPIDYDDSTKLNAVTIRFHENHPTMDMICVLGAGGTLQVFRSSGASRSQQSHTFNPVSINRSLGYEVWCQLPPNTSGTAPSIVNYTIDRN
jgi:hypothetical protein